MSKMTIQTIYEALDLLLKNEGGIESFMASEKRIIGFDNGTDTKLTIKKISNTELSLLQGGNGKILEMTVKLYPGVHMVEVLSFMEKINRDAPTNFSHFQIHCQLNDFLSLWLKELKQEGYFKEEGGSI